MGGVESLFDGVELEVGNVISCTRGIGVNRETYISNMMNEIERKGFVVELIKEDGRKIDFYLKDRRNQNA